MALFIKTSMLALLTARANALTIQSAVFLGNVTSTPNDQAVRDNGYSGNVGTAIIDTFDDSSQCDNAYYQTNCGYPNYYTYTNSAGVGKSPTSFQDEPSSSAPNYFCGYTYGEDAPTNALGISNVVPTSATSGVVYTFAYRRNLPGSNPSIGAGVGSVSISNGVPTCTRLAQNWWSGLTESWYGVDSAFLDSSGSYIYAIGPANTTNAGGGYIYITRVPVGQATTLSAYQYWNGNSYTSTRITAGAQYALKDTSGPPMMGVGQGQGMYNKHLGQYIYCDRNGLDYHVHCRTAAKPEGPWSTPTPAFDSLAIGGCGALPHYNGETYAASFHPWYDDWQKSVVM